MRGLFKCCLYSVACSLLWGIMKIRHSLRSAKKRERNCRIVRRKGRLYVINKKHPRYKARQK